MHLAEDVRYIKGIGPKRSLDLRNLGISTIVDLLNHLPYRVDDFSRVTPMDLLKQGDSVTVIGTVLSTQFLGSRRGRVFRVCLSDGRGLCHLTWYNMPYVAQNFAVGERVAASGKVEWRRHSWEMPHPLWHKTRDQVEAGPVVPVYHGSSALSSHAISRFIREALRVYLPVIQKSDRLVSGILVKNGYLPLETAYKEIHDPSSKEMWERAKDSLAFRELLELQVAFALMRSRLESSPGPRMSSFVSADTFLRSLPFELTCAQKRAIFEIQNDLSSGRPMNRLLQGDVGSGKTVVAAYALIAAIENGYQGAFLAPTDILARQHFDTLNRLNPDLNPRLLTGSLALSAKQEVKDAMASGLARLVVGTHAMLSAGIEWHNLGLVVTDEQHRFGVLQRLKLGQVCGNMTPHTLVMSATPIPRSLALTLYGDLDISVIDEMPQGRLPVDTHVLSFGQRERAYRVVRQEVERGRQAYVVCPVIEESDSGRRSVNEVFEELSTRHLKDLRLAVLHGGISRTETERVMESFVAGTIDVLVSTTVIEVGIDVPNASCMVVEGAESFGLATLHQLRGRVGRGSHKSQCFLVSSGERPFPRRLEMLKSTNDGLKVAEFDLIDRGPGQFFGQRQHGLPEMRASILGISRDLVQKARDEARRLMDSQEEERNAVLKAVEDRFGDLKLSARSR